MQLPADLGKYELFERLASGGMAELFLARSRGPAGVQKVVAIKCIRPEHAEDPKFINLFINEARIGVHLSHPNIVHVFELGRSGRTWFIAMEFVHGRDLMRLLRRARDLNERLPVAVAVHIVAELCRGLHYAHSRTDQAGEILGMVHQDISPHNILLSFSGEVKLVDFGIARFLHAPPGVEPLAPPGRGKFAYASPECCGSDAITPAADLYSCGVVLWELLSGERPFAQLEPAAKLRAIQHDGLCDLQAIRPDLDPTLCEIVARATARAPQDRFPSTGSLEEALRAWLYEAGERVGSADVSRWVHRFFPDAAAPSSVSPAKQFAHDLERLDPEISVTPSPSPLPGKLQVSAGERKQVAVLVVDVDGLTALSAQLEPERFARRNFRLLRWVRAITDRWGGVFQRAIDDHLFILFGVPLTREDDLSRAMDCAVELIRRREELLPKGLNLEFCIGLHAGEVSLTTGRRRVQYVARGNTTRLARRLSASADHGEILASERVLSQMAADFQLRQGPTIPSRGGRPGVPSYRVIGRRAGVPLTRIGPWLRRGGEVEQLRDAVEELGEGRGASVVILGPVGSGKTRLIQELSGIARKRSVPFYTARLGLRGVQGLVEEVVGIEAGATATVMRAQIADLAQIGISKRGIEVLCGLVGVPSRNAPERNEVVAALVSLVRGLTLGGVAIVALETEGLGSKDLIMLGEIIRRCAGSPVLFLLVCRPPVPQVLKSVSEVIQLGPFSQGSQQQLIASVLGVREVGASLMQLVLRTCEGNALYISEMVKYLFQQNKLHVTPERAILLDETVDLPGSLHGLIMARIDALDAATKGCLQLASVIGPTFSSALIGRAAGLEDPSALLMELLAAGLIQRDPEGWAFASELVREAASRGIMGVQRRDYHRLVSEAIETIYADNPDRFAAELSSHCALGGRPLDAARYARQAGLASERRGRLSSAIQYYRSGLRWIDSASDPALYDARMQGEATLHLLIGKTLLLRGEGQRARRHLVISLDISSEGGLPWIAARAHVQLGWSHIGSGQLRLAEAHLQQAADLADVEQELELELETLEARATLALELGEHGRAQDYWEQVLCRTSGNPARAARCQIGLATRWLASGETQRASPMLASALEAARSAGDRILEGRILNNTGMMYSLMGDYETALSFYRQALELREGIGYTRGVAINHHNIGDVYFQTGEWSKAYVAFARSREVAVDSDWAPGVVLNDVFLAYLEARRGHHESDRFDEIRSRSLALGSKETAVTALYLQGRSLLEHEISGGAELVERASAEAHRYGFAALFTQIINFQEKVLP